MGNPKRKTDAKVTRFPLTRIGCIFLAAFASVSPARPQDTNCPAYPTAVRIVADRAIDLDRLDDSVLDANGSSGHSRRRESVAFGSCAPGGGERTQ